MAFELHMDNLKLALSYTCPQRPCGCGFRSPATVQLELGLVDTFLRFCRLGWQAGWLKLISVSFVLCSSPNRVEQILLYFGFEHVTAAAASHSVGKLMGKKQMGHLSRVIMYKNVNHYLFSLSSSEARLSLGLQFIDFLGGKSSLRISANSST
nr:uncharacterized protein LOC114819923 [Malus domestica]